MPVENITDLTMSDVCNLAICLNCPDSTGNHTKSHQVLFGNEILSVSASVTVPDSPISAPDLTDLDPWGGSNLFALDTAEGAHYICSFHEEGPASFITCVLNPAVYDINGKSNILHFTPHNTTQHSLCRALVSTSSNSSYSVHQNVSRGRLSLL